MPTKTPPVGQSAAKATPRKRAPTVAASKEQAPKFNKVTPENKKVSKKPGLSKKTVKPASQNAPGGDKTKSTYSDKVAQTICELLSEGVPLREICRMNGMPAWRTVYDWKAARTDFAARIAHAREAGFDAIAEECLEIADHTANDTLIGDNGERANAEWISRSKVRIETRLKLLAKWDPKRYGDKVDVNHGVQPENPLASLLAQIQGTPLRPKDSE